MYQLFLFSFPKPQVKIRLKALWGLSPPLLNTNYLLQVKSWDLHQRSRPTAGTYKEQGPFHKWYNTNWSWWELWTGPSLSTRFSLHPPFQTDAPQLCPPAPRPLGVSWFCCLLQRHKEYTLWMETACVLITLTKNKNSCHQYECRNTIIHYKPMTESIN